MNIQFTLYDNHIIEENKIKSKMHVSSVWEKGFYDNKIKKWVFVDSYRRNPEEYEYIKIISMYQKLMLLFFMLEMF